MEREARAALRREGFADARQRHTPTVAARYRGQSFELEVAWEAGSRLVERFHREHEARYGYAQTAGSIEVVSARLLSAGLVEELKEKRLRRTPAAREFAEPHGAASVHFDERAVAAAVYRRDELRAGARLRVPCVVTEYSSTTLVPAGARCTTDAGGNLSIEL